jgi:hypothetical protein
MFSFKFKVSTQLTVDFTRSHGLGDAGLAWRGQANPGPLFELLSHIACALSLSVVGDSTRRRRGEQFKFREHIP